MAASLKSRCALLLVEDLWEVGQGALLHLKYLSKEEEAKAFEENDILVIKKADSLFGGKCQNHQVCTQCQGREGSEKLRVGAYNVRIPDCLFKSKS